MDLLHSNNAHVDYSPYGHGLNKNHAEQSQHNTYWHWQHSDGSSEGFPQYHHQQQQSIFNASHWHSSPPPSDDAGFALLSPPSRPNSAPEWNSTYFRYMQILY